MATHSALAARPLALGLFFVLWTASCRPRDTPFFAPSDSPKAGEVEGPCGNRGKLIEGGILASRLDPKKTTKIAPFCYHTNEVTVALYTNCFENKACSAPIAYAATDKNKLRALCNYKHPEGRAEHPMNCVTFAQASSFCTVRGARLPTQEEFEWAAGGREEHRTFTWGTSAPKPKSANSCGPACSARLFEVLKLKLEPLFDTEDGFAETAPIGSFATDESRDGVRDLAGNVREWTSTSKGMYRIVKGGSFASAAAGRLSVEETEKELPTAYHPNLGFRCVKNL